MQYIIDIALVAVFGIVVAVSAKKGFFVTLFELAAYLISVVSAKILSASLAPQFFENFFSGAIKDKITQSLGDVAQADYSAKVAAAIDSIPQQFDGIMQSIGVNKQELVSQVSGTGLSGQKFIDHLMTSIVSPVATAVIRVLLFVVIAFVLSIVLRVVVRVLDKVIKKLPVIGNINSGLGAVLGIIKGLLVVVLLALIISTVSSFTTSQQFIEVANSSIIIKGINGILLSISGYSV